MNIWSGSMIHEMDVEETIIQLLIRCIECGMIIIY